MSANPQPDSLSESERLDVAADQAIAACGGDMRSAIRALILANEYLESEIVELFKAVSNGYARQRFREIPSDDLDAVSRPRREWYD